MPVPFGFSIGDFLTALNLFKELTVALKDQGGSCSDFRKTIIDLETIAGILLELQSLQPADNNFSHINSIRAQAHRTYHDVQQFLFSIEKFKDKLGPRSAPGFHRGMLAKIKWSQCTATKFKELRETVHLQSANIQTLLSLLIQHNQNADRALFTTTFTKHSLAIESLATHVESIETALRQNCKTIESPAIGAFKNSSERSEAIVNGTRTENHDGQNRVASHEPMVCLHLDSASIDNTLKALPVQNLHGNLATSSESGKLKGPICTSSPHKGLSPAKRSVLSSEGPSLEPQMILSQKLLVDISLAIASYLVSEGNTVLQQIARSLLVFLKMFLLSLPRVLVLLRLLRQVPRAVPLIVGDNIQFEDALGRIQSLQYQYFKHWTVFEACLRCTFNNTPGMQKVLQGQYVLNCKGARDGVLDATNWGENASPGMFVTMSISIRTILTLTGHCPTGCAAKTTTIISGSEACCMQCDLTFSVRRPPQTDVLRTFNFMAKRQKPTSFRGSLQMKRPEKNAATSTRQGNKERMEPVAGNVREQHKIDSKEVRNLLRYESVRKEAEEHRLEMQEITHFKRVHLIEEIVLKWTWVFNRDDKPWYWAWYVELPATRADWRRADFWEPIAPDLANQITRDLSADDQAGGDDFVERFFPLSVGFNGNLRKEVLEISRQSKAMEMAKRRAAIFSQATHHTQPSFKRTYTVTYTGPLSVSDSMLFTAKIPFIHLLAIQPLTPRQISYRLALPKLERDELLAIFARDCPSDPDKKELQVISYKELDVWGFPYHKQSARQAAIDRSIQAFDILRIDKHDDLWQTLLPPEQRGQRIYLSRRHSD